MQRRNRELEDQSRACYKKTTNGPKAENSTPNAVGAIISRAACGCSRRKAKVYIRKRKDYCVYPRAEKVFVLRPGSFSRKTSVGACDEMQVAKNEARVREEINPEKRKKQSCMAVRQIENISSSFSRMFRKSIGLHSRKWKAIAASNNNGGPNGTKSTATKQSCQKVKCAKLRQRGNGEHGEIKQHDVKEAVQEDDNRGMELCKKRILMGEKCRALNSSGTLHYDEDGILLPEDVSSSQES